MRNLFLLLIGFFLSASGLLAQNCTSQRYKARIFQSQRTQDVVFGNAPELTPVYVNEFTTTNNDLTMDIYQPVGDTLQKRPCILMAFGGGFIIGSKEDADIQAFCDTFATRGYVTASINYRKNMNVTSSASGERAVFRATQDYSAAIRFIKEKSDSLRIDTNLIFIGGASAGAFAALHCAYMEEADRPASTYAQSGLFARPDLGCIDCEGNNYQHSREVAGVINCWGAIGDTIWIETGEAPVISFHGDNDAIVPYEYGFPFTALFTLPRVLGSRPISGRALHQGIEREFHPFPGEGHNLWGTIVNNGWGVGPTQNWEPILDSIQDFLYPLLQPDPAYLTGARLSEQGRIETYAVAPSAGHWYCWEVSGGTIVSSNQNGPSVDVRWDTLGLDRVWVTEYSEVRAPAARQLREVIVLNSTGLDAGFEEKWVIYPNPGVGWVAVSGPRDGVQVNILDIWGRLVCTGQTGSKIDVSQLSRGIYRVEVREDEQRKVFKWVKNQ